MTYPTALTSQYQALADPEQTLLTTVESIISSYNSPWDVLTELVQNSIDAINDRKKRDPAFQGGKILLTVDSLNGTLTVEDNGCGIPSGRYADMILPGGSLKRTGNTYGHKGLGFTYCAHIADSIEVETLHLDGGTEHWSLEGGFSWVNDRASNSAKLVTGISKPLRTLSGFGTAVKVKLAIGRYEANRANTAVLDGFFDWAADEKLLSFVLRTRTAIGQTFDLFQRSAPTPIDVTVELKNVKKTFSVPYAFFDFYNYPPISSATYPKATDYANNVYLNATQLSKTHFGIYHVFDTDPTASPPLLKVGAHHGGVRFSAYVYCCGKENLNAALTSYDQRLATSHQYLGFTTDVYLSIAGMPCGVPIDSWNNFGGFEQRYFCIIDVDLSFGKFLDAGRKTITRHYVDLFTKKVIDLTKDPSFFGTVSFYSLAQQLNNKTTNTPHTTVAALIAEWQSLSPLASKELLVRVVPKDELAVYVMFGELVGRGFLPGWKVLYVSGSATYDAAMEFRYDFADPGFKNSTAGGTCTLGPGATAAQRYPKKGHLWSDASGARTFLVVECKVAAQDLLAEIQARKSVKDFTQIDVLVCADFDDAAIKNLSGTIHKVMPAARQFSGVTHVLHYGTHQIQVVSLRTVVDELVAAKQLS